MSTLQGDYPISKLARAFRDFTQEEFDGLKFSMAELGQTDPITLLGKEVFDGRHRLRACDELGLTPWFEDLPEGVNPIRYLIAKNGSRRHMTPSERAVAAAKLSAWFRPGGDRKSEAYREDHSANLQNDPDQQEIARLLGVSPRMVSHAARVLSEDGPAAPAVRAAVERGEIKVSDAARIIDRPAEVQELALERVRSGSARTVTSAAGKIMEEGDEQTPARPPAGLYRTIVVDPVWPAADPRTGELNNGPDSAPASMAVEEIAGMELPLHDDGFVFLWTTQQWLPHSLKVLEEWGLRYRFTMMWQKPAGIQPPNSPEHDVEFIVAGSRGDPEFTSNFRFSSVIKAPCRDPVAGHTVKPQALYDLLRNMTPGPRLELPESGVKHWRVWQERTR